MRSHGVPFVLALVLSATAHGQDASRRLGQAPFEVVITPETIAHDGRVIASVAGSGEGGYDGRLHVTSLVGPVLSYHREESGLDDEEPWFDEVWETVDLRSGAPVLLEALVEPGAAIHELRPHPFLVEEMGSEPRLLAARTLAALDAVLGEHEIERRGLAIVAYDERANLATFRIFARAPRLHLQFQPVSLDVVVQPATWLRPYLRSPDEGSGGSARTFCP